MYPPSKLVSKSIIGYSVVTLLTTLLTTGTVNNLLVCALNDVHITCILYPSTLLLLLLLFIEHLFCYYASTCRKTSPRASAPAGESSGLNVPTAAYWPLCAPATASGVWGLGPTSLF